MLLGSDRPLVVTSGTALAANVNGQPSTEESPIGSLNPRVGMEHIVKDFVNRGVNISVVRLSQIHDTRKQGLVPYALAVTARKASRPTSATAAIAGPRPTYPPSRSCTAWPSRKRSPAPSITPSTKRACR